MAETIALPEVEVKAQPDEPPPFDPKQPFVSVANETVQGGGKDDAPAFDPSQPSKPVEKSVSSGGGIKEAFGAIQDLPKGTVVAKSALKRAGQSAKDASSAYRTNVLKMAPDVDYETGAPYQVQVDAQRASNEKEVEAALERYYGEGNYGHDESGRWWVKGQEGKKVSLFPYASSLSTGVSSMQAAGPEMGGMMVGAAAGVPFGPPGMFAGGVVGALAGKGIDEAVKYFQDFYRKTPQELAETMNSVGVWNTLLSGAGPTAKNVFGPVGQKIRNYLGVTPETRELTRKALESGTVPPVASTAEFFKSFADKQKLRNIVMGDPQMQTKVAALHSQARDALRSEGYSDAEIEKVMTQILDPMTALPESEVGAALTPAVKAHTTGLQARADAYLDEAKRATAHSRKMFETVAKRPIGEFGSNVAEAVQGARSSLGRAFEPAYSHIDEMVGGRAIVPTALIKQEAELLSKYIPPDRVPAIFNEIADMPDMVTASAAHRLRSQLRSKATSGNLTPDISEHEFGQVAGSVDAAFRQAAKEGPLNKQAVTFMRQIDKLYGEQIKFFRDARVNEIARLAEAGVPPDPEVVARLIGEVGYTERLKQMLDKFTPEMKRAVATADMKMMFRDTERQTAALGFDSPGKAFYTVVNERKPLLQQLYEPVYGRGFVEKLENTAKELAALDGKVDLKTLEQKMQGLGPGTLLDALTERVTALKELDTFAKTNPLSALNSGKPEAVDAAYRNIVQPKADKLLQDVYSFFGEGPEMDAIRNFARKEVLKSAVYENPARMKMIDGPAIEQAFSKFSKYQQEILFPNGAAQDLKEIAKMSRFLFPESMAPEFATSQAAKSITLHTGVNIFNPRTLYADLRWSYVAAMGWLTDRPALARMIAGLEKAEPSVGRKMMNAVMRWSATSYAHEGPSKAQPSKQPPPPNMQRTENTAIPSVVPPPATPKESVLRFDPQGNLQ